MAVSVLKDTGEVEMGELEPTSLMAATVLCTQCWR